MAAKRVYTAGGGSMVKIINGIIKKINSNKLFYTFILASEFTYLLVFWGILFVWGCGSKMGNIKLLSDIGGFSFLIGIPCFLIVHISYIISSFFATHIKKFRDTIILLFLFRLFLLIFVFNIFGYTA